MKTAMIYGNGTSGKGADILLQKENYKTVIVDDKTGILSKDALNMLDNIDIFVKSPGIPYNDLLKKVKENNILILDEIEVAYNYLKKYSPKTKIIAITGTNGKTTVTTKLTELLKYCGYKAEYAGNIGVSFAEVINKNLDLDFIVLELSSFQLENIHNFCPDLALITNLTPDHIERYDNIESYYNVKFNICKNQDVNTTFIVNKDSDKILKILDKIDLKAKKIFISQKTIADIFVNGDFIYYKSVKIIQSSKLALKGKHNLENMLFVIAAALHFELPNNKICEFLYKTKTIEHRMEEFFDYGKIKFINDSKGTNIESSQYAIEAFEQNILICGGYDKHLPLDHLVELIKKHVKEVYLIGANRLSIQNMLININYDKEKIHNVETIENALLDLKKKLNPQVSTVVLLSPATSSYDQFKNFEERGKYFKKLVIEMFGAK